MTEDSFPLKGTVQETMLGPLWARATFSKIYPELLYDKKAIEIIQKVDYDFSGIQLYLEEWRGLGLLARARNFDDTVREFITDHPNSTIVNIGAGLDTTFFRVDNEKIRWYDLDLPDAIEFRKKFLSESDRNNFIAKSAFDLTWFDQIEYNKDDGIFFIAGGFIYYFTEEDISSLFDAIARKFPAGELIFDCISKIAMKVANKRAKKAGIYPKHYFSLFHSHLLDFWHLSVGNPTKQVPNWSDKLQVKEWYTMWKKLPINPVWSKKTLRMIKISERLRTSKIVHIKFKE
ncbi:MAG: class I SAM-dependent methyltransferase [Candidatus Hodarchaeales archaeon]|jgi:O-methyltransferase involved in polyketide biosynthesis